MAWRWRRTGEASRRWRGGGRARAASSPLLSLGASICGCAGGRVAAGAPSIASEMRPRGKVGRTASESTTSTPSISNVIVIVFLCLLVFVFVDIRAMGTVLLDVAPLAAAVAHVLVRVRDGLQQSTRR
jgi:hypothetical protein